MAEKILHSQADRSLVSEGKPSLGEDGPLAVLNPKIFYLKNNGDREVVRGPGGMMIKETKGRRPVEHPELEGGRYWTLVPWSTWKGTGWRRGRSSDCYRRAAMFAIEHPKLKYVEGFAFGPPHDVVYAHAWNVDVEGRVIERTWNVFDHWVEQMTYYGVVVDIKEVAKHIIKRDVCGPILPIVEEFQRKADEKEKGE